MKWILFDAYGTLFKAGKYNLTDIANMIAKENGLPAQRIFELWTTRYVELERDVQRGFRTIEDTNKDSLTYVFDILKIESDPDKYIRVLTDLWSHPYLIDGVFELLQWLSVQNCKIGIVSNSDEKTLQSAIECNALPIASYISSEKAKSYKPSPDIFRFALNEFECNPEDCIYIGNSRNDMISATSFGIKCVILTPEKDSHGSDCMKYLDATVTMISEISDSYSIITSFLAGI